MEANGYGQHRQNIRHKWCTFDTGYFLSVSFWMAKFKFDMLVRQSKYLTTNLSMEAQFTMIVEWLSVAFDMA